MTRRRDVVAALTALLCIVFTSPWPVAGQTFWSKDTKRIPMTPTWLAEKAKLPPYSPPRTPDGVPDFQGLWDDSGGDGIADLEEHEFLDATSPSQETFISDPPDGKVPYTPWARAKRDEFRRGLGRGWPGQSGERLHGSPRSLCMNSFPRIMEDGGQEVIQRPGMVIMVSSAGWHRIIYTDGRPHVGGKAGFWFGNSRGRWEGDTLVVEVHNNNGRGWFDTAGNFYTANTKFTERWRLADANTLDYALTVEDPTIYTRPWTINFPKKRPGMAARHAGTLPNATAGLPSTAGDRYAKEVWEEACFEGNHENTITQREIGFKWYPGVTPPAK